MENNDNFPSNNGRNAMEEELIKGREIANQLLEVIVHNKSNNNGDFEVEEGLILPYAEDLARKVLGSFTNSLLLFNSNDEVIVPITSKDFSSSENCTKDTDEGCKSFLKNRRGCYKRKSTAPTWERDSSVLIEDGYAWRKYGQKKTNNAKYLRSYYRCTHKYDENCPAIKQVQRIEEEPPLYKTTYYGHHNCKSSLLNPDIMLLEPTSESDCSMYLSFKNCSLGKEEINNPFSSSASPILSTKQEPNKEEEVTIPNDHIAAHHNQLSSSDYLSLRDYELDFNYLLC